MLRLTDLNKSFGSSQILSGVGMDVDKGDVLAVLGPSGSGKTTMLRCLNYLERADSGRLTFMDMSMDMAAASRKQIADYRMHTAFVFQNFNLFANKTALQNITEGLTVVRKMPVSEAEERGMKALDRVGLSDKASSYPGGLSGGQQQRVAIARAIAAEPDIIYFDEPTSALDPELIREVLDVIQELAEDGMTMIIVTHEVNFARHVASRVMFMENGRIIKNEKTVDFFDNQQDERIRSFLNTIDRR